MREIIFQTYSLEQVLEALEEILKKIPKHLEEKTYHELYEELVFLSFALSMIKKNDHQLSTGFQYINLQLGLQVPTFETLKSIIGHFMQLSEEADEEDKE